MRIALSKIGASEIKNKQLFLDEGFTACDSDNLTKVPEFLNRLLVMYDSIILVTHLDELKECVDNTFDVTTDFKVK
jgi:DNA repair exonuclease SbcCD ATPase subunit